MNSDSKSLSAPPITRQGTRESSELLPYKAVPIQNNTQNTDYELIANLHDLDAYSFDSSDHSGYPTEGEITTGLYVSRRKRQWAWPRLKASLPKSLHSIKGTKRKIVRQSLTNTAITDLLDDSQEFQCPRPDKARETSSFEKMTKPQRVQTLTVGKWWSRSHTKSIQIVITNERTTGEWWEQSHIKLTPPDDAVQIPEVEHEEQTIIFYNENEDPWDTEMESDSEITAVELSASNRFQNRGREITENGWKPCQTRSNSIKRRDDWKPIQPLLNPIEEETSIQPNLNPIERRYDWKPTEPMLIPIEEEKPTETKLIDIKRRNPSFVRRDECKPIRNSLNQIKRRKSIIPRREEWKPIQPESNRMKRRNAMNPRREERKPIQPKLNGVQQRNTTIWKAIENKPKRMERRNAIIIRSKKQKAVKRKSSSAILQNIARPNSMGVNCPSVKIQSNCWFGNGSMFFLGIVATALLTTMSMIVDDWLACRMQ